MNVQLTKKLKTNRKVSEAQKAKRRIKRDAKRSAKLAGEIVQSEARFNPSGVRSIRSRADGNRVRLGQNTGRKSGLPTPVRNAMLAIANPTMSKDFRWVAANATAPTATATPWARNPVQFAVAATDEGQLPKDQAFTIVRRIPEAAIIEYDANPGGDTFNYSLYMMGAGATPSPTVPLIVSTLDYPIHFVYGLSTVNYSPHGPTMFAGSYNEEDLRFFWVNALDTFNLLWTNDDVASRNFTVTWWTYDLEGGIVPYKTETVTVAAGAQGSSFINPATIDTYVSCSMFASAINVPITIDSSNITGGGYCFAHKCIPDYETNVEVIESVRIVGASVMFSNRAAVLGLQGSCYGLQVGEGKCWKNWVNNIDEVASSNGSVESKAATGMYGFLKPNGPDDFSPTSYTVVKNGVIVDSKWPIHSDHDYLILYTTIPLDDGKAAFYTYGFSIEYRTNDVFRDLDISHMTPEHQSAVMSKIGDLEQWYENKTHIVDILKDIGAIIERGAKFVATNGPKVISAVEKNAPMIQNILQMLSRMA